MRVKSLCLLVKTFHKLISSYIWDNDPQNKPYATNPPFRWYVAGSINMIEDRFKSLTFSLFEFVFEERQSSVDLHEQVEKFWACASHGFIDTADSIKSIEDKRALKILNSKTLVESGRYEVYVVE